MKILNHVILVTGWVLVSSELHAASHEEEALRRLTSINGTFWTPVHASRAGFPINDVHHAQGKWLAVGDGSTIMSSDNGVDWQRIHPIGELAFTSVSFHDGVWLIATEQGMILYSHDAMSWRLAGTPLKEEEHWLGETGQPVFAQNRWMAISGGQLIESTDGTMWEVMNPAPDIDFYSLEYGNDSWMGIGHDQLFISQDGVHWESIDLTPFLVERSESEGRSCRCRFPGSYRALKIGGGRWVLVGHGEHVLVSEDGLHWNFAEIPELPSSAEFTGIHYAGGEWVLYGDDGETSETPLDFYLTSTDGIQWNILPYLEPLPVQRDPIRSMAQSGSRWVAAHPDGILTSADGLQWHAVDAGSQVTSDIGTIDMHFANNLWVAGGYRGIFVSQDGKNWLKAEMPSGHQIEHLHFADDTWVAVSQGGGVLAAASDAMKWERMALLPGDRTGIGYGNGTWIVTGSRPQMHVSTDLRSWQEIEMLAPESLYDVTFAQDQWVAVGAWRPVEFSPNGEPRSWNNTDFIIRSKNGLDWDVVLERRLSAVGFYSIEFAEGEWLVGGGGMVSNDGMTWSRKASIYGLTSSLAYGDGLWMGVAGNNISVWDGQEGRYNEMGADTRSLNLNAIAYGQGRFLAMGSRHALTHTVITDPPVLNIQSIHEGLEISWDVYYSDYALQIGETPDGPYSTLEQMPAIGNFQLSHTFEPTSENARFFRLQKIN